MACRYTMNWYRPPKITEILKDPVDLRLSPG